MYRLDEKEILIKKFCDIFSLISRYTGQINPGIMLRGRYIGCLPKRAVRAMHRSITKDLIGGLRDLNKKIPRYVEMPTLKKEGNGMYSESYDGDTNSPKDKEIIVPELPDFISPNLIENNNKNTPLIDG